MVLTVKNKASYYKRFHLDIWGILRTTTQYIQKPQHPLKEVLYEEIEKGIKKANKLPEGEKKVFLQNLAQKKRETEEMWQNPIKPTSVENSHTDISYLRGSRKVSSLLDFFYQHELKRRAANLQKYRRYIYRLDIIQRPYFLKRLKHRFVSLRLVKLFYITWTYRNFRRLARNMRDKMGNFQENFLLALEGRAVSALYRTALIANPFECLEMIRGGNLVINNKCEYRIDVRIPLNTIIKFTPLGKRYIYLQLLNRLSKKRSLFNPPLYMFVSYMFLFCYMQRAPRREDLVFPIAVDFYRATGYAF